MIGTKEKTNIIANKLKSYAVRILKPGLTDRVSTIEAWGTRLVSRLPEHPHVLREHVLRPGVSVSRLYDESLHQHCVKHSLDRVGLQTIITALAKGVLHLHQHNVGHFDIKPQNVLIKWSHTRGIFEGTNVVLSDFGLVAELAVELGPWTRRPFKGINRN